jgi:thiol-disulfide isomerase/thioredoxin
MRLRWLFLAALLVGASWSCAPSTSESVGATEAGPEITPATAEEVMTAVRASKAPVVLVNVWATWCIPCREEFPDLMKLERTYRDRGFDLVLVSADFEDQIPAARRFLAQHGVQAASFIKTGDDMHFINTLSPSWTGALPATMIFDRSRRLRGFREGKASYSWLEQQVLEALNASSEEERS